MYILYLYSGAFFELDELIWVICLYYRYRQLSFLVAIVPNMSNLIHYGKSLKFLSQAILNRNGHFEFFVLLKQDKPVNCQFQFQCGVFRVFLIIKGITQTIGVYAYVQTRGLIFLFRLFQVQYHLFEVFAIGGYCIKAKGYRPRELLNSMIGGFGLLFFGIKLLLFFLIFRFILFSKFSCLFLRCCFLFD